MCVVIGTSKELESVVSVLTGCSGVSGSVNTHTHTRLNSDAMV